MANGESRTPSAIFEPVGGSAIKVAPTQDLIGILRDQKGLPDVGTEPFRVKMGTSGGGSVTSAEGRFHSWVFNPLGTVILAFAKENRGKLEIIGLAVGGEHFTLTPEDVGTIVMINDKATMVYQGQEGREAVFTPVRARSALEFKEEPALPVLLPEANKDNFPQIVKSLIGIEGINQPLTDDELGRLLWQAGRLITGPLDRGGYPPEISIRALAAAVVAHRSYVEVSRRFDWQVEQILPAEVLSENRQLMPVFKALTRLANEVGKVHRTPGVSEAESNIWQPRQNRVGRFQLTTFAFPAIHIKDSRGQETCQPFLVACADEELPVAQQELLKRMAVLFGLSSQGKTAQAEVLLTSQILPAGVMEEAFVHLLPADQTEGSDQVDFNLILNLFGQDSGSVSLLLPRNSPFIKGLISRGLLAQGRQSSGKNMTGDWVLCDRCTMTQGDSVQFMAMYISGKNVENEVVTVSSKLACPGAMVVVVARPFRD